MKNFQIILLLAILPIAILAQGGNNKIEFAQKLQDNNMPHINPVICAGSMIEEDLMWLGDDGKKYKLGTVQAGAATSRDAAYLMVAPVAGLSVSKIMVNKTVNEYETPLHTSWAKVRIANKKCVKVDVGATLVVMGPDGKPSMTFDVLPGSRLEICTKECCDVQILNGY